MSTFEKEEMKDAVTVIMKALTVRDRIADVLIRNSAKVQNRLYIQLHPLPQPNEMLSLMPAVYEAAAKHCPKLDVRLLLGVEKPNLTKIFEDSLTESDIRPSAILRKEYDYVVLGGTFDRIHYGHKLLLSTAVLLANKYVVCGVTDREMNQSKVLWELIQPVGKRINDVAEFVYDISEGVELRAEPIIDPFGPSIVDSKLQCIVVSHETIKGGDAVNRKRKEKGLSILDVRQIALLEGIDELLNEQKLSSSSMRRAVLGKRLLPPKQPEYDYAKEKYVIGLTGGICSGKTHISNFLQNRECSVGNLFEIDLQIIDCDKIGHYLFGNSKEIRKEIVENFGADLIKDGIVDRRALGGIVFKDENKLQKLNSIMWPRMADKVLDEIRTSKSKIVVVDAAVLLKAGWDKFAHEVWVSIVPKSEALVRVQKRDNLSAELAADRVNSQPPNSDLVSKANVVFCTLWDYTETERQVDIALRTVRESLTIKMSSDDYEDAIIVADLNGVLDPEGILRAVAEGNVILRFPDTKNPLIQVGSSAFAAEWSKTSGTDMIFEVNAAELDPMETNTKQFDLISTSRVRLTADKVVVSAPSTSVDHSKSLPHSIKTEVEEIASEASINEEPKRKEKSKAQRSTKTVTTPKKAPRKVPQKDSDETISQPRRSVRIVQKQTSK